MPDETMMSDPVVDPYDSQPISVPPTGGGTTSNTTLVFGAGFILGAAAGVLVATAIYNGQGTAAATGGQAGVVVQASPDAGAALPPPAETAPAEQRPAQ